jgi:hypothetical protein
MHRDCRTTGACRKIYAAVCVEMVPAEGFEPPTTRLRSGCSTTELRRLTAKCGKALLIAVRTLFFKVRPDLDQKKNKRFQPGEADVESGSGSRS